MNSSDEEVSINEGVQEINETGVAEERIVRHAEKNDSYRESPDLEEEIVQPPLEKAQKTTSAVEGQFSENELISPLPPFESTYSDTEKIAPLPPMTQHDIEPEGEIHNEAVNKEEVSESEPEMPLQQAKQQDQEQEQPQAPQEEVPAPQAEKVVYHTISGGPETLVDIAAHQPKVKQPIEIPDYRNAPSGYTIPNPDYVSSIPPVPPAAPVVTTSSNFGVIFFFIFILTLGGAIGYVYFVMPEIFNQAFSAMIVVKDQLLKK
jgi:hypothetical protein